MPFIVGPGGSQVGSTAKIGPELEPDREQPAEPATPQDPQPEQAPEPAPEEPEAA